MLLKNAIALCVVTALFGCGRTSLRLSGQDVSQMIQIEVVHAKEHLGHEIAASDGNPIWCDGCRARLLHSGDPFVIYWIDNAIENTSFRFDPGKKYTVVFTGQVGARIIGYEGKCIDLRQVVKLEEQ